MRVKVNLQMVTRLAIKLEDMLKAGYKTGPHYIGMLNEMFLFCPMCEFYHWHQLLARNGYDYRYCCKKCNQVTEYV
jgi:hypothetical protein